VKFGTGYLSNSVDNNPNLVKIRKKKYRRIYMKTYVLLLLNNKGFLTAAYRTTMQKERIATFLWQLLHNDYTVDTAYILYKDQFVPRRKHCLLMIDLKSKRQPGEYYQYKNILYPNNNTKQKALLHFYVNSGYPNAQQH